MAGATNKYTKRFAKEFALLAKPVVDDLQSRLVDADPKDVSKIVAATLAKHNVEKGVQNAFLDAIQHSAELSVDVPDPVSFRKYYLKDVRAVDGVKLSSKLHDLTRTSEISSTIKQSLQVKEKWNTAANTLVDSKITTAELPKYMSELVRYARNGATINGDRTAFLKYRAAVERQISGLTDASDSSELARAYRDVAELTDKASTDMFEASVDRAVMYKARANAQRLVDTESQRAYANARVLEIKSDEDAIGVHFFTTSEDERLCEVCSELESQDLGMGPGNYPLSNIPAVPQHPNCHCGLDPIYRGDPEAYDDSDSKLKDWEDHEDISGLEDQVDVGE